MTIHPRFGLKTLLTVVAVVAVIAGWHKWRLDRQHEARLALEALGCTLYYDVGYDNPWSAWAMRAKIPARSWIGHLIGHQYAAQIRTVAVQAGEAEAATPHPKKLPFLRETKILGTGGCLMGGRLEDHHAVEKIRRQLPSVKSEACFLTIPVVG